MAKEKQKIDNPAAFVVILVLFLASLVLLTLGLIRSRNKQPVGRDLNEETIKTGGQEDSISEYFKDEFAQTSGETDRELLKSDPFKEACAETSGDDIPAISFGTVCMR